ncbi:hypothetical protein R5R35_013981 [Gryllus longicercus]|uniref:Thioredoxin domain-containing protein n=1 Tax=Gryllus longicercus TaxID=2509291 RepID=A0AAN9VI91_9ORTH
MTKKTKKVKLQSEERPERSDGIRVREVLNEEQFAKELWDAEDQLVVVQFTAKWSVPYPNLAARFRVLSEMYSHALFLKVDADKCKETANNLEIYFTPTFVLYRDQELLEIIRGPDMKSLELYIAVHYGAPY